MPNIKSAKKRVLVISQKKAALDVVYNRLGPLNEKAMYIMDETKERAQFYEKCIDAHNRDMQENLADVSSLQKEYNDIQARIDEEEAKLDVEGLIGEALGNLKFINIE